MTSITLNIIIVILCIILAIFIILKLNTMYFTFIIICIIIFIILLTSKNIYDQSHIIDGYQICANKNADVYWKQSNNANSTPYSCCDKSTPQNINNKIVCTSGSSDHLYSICAENNNDLYWKQSNNSNLPPYPCCDNNSVDKVINGKHLCISGKPTPPTPTPTPTPSSNNIKIGTLNLHTNTVDSYNWNNRVLLLKQVISQMNCDILCVQEANQQMIYDLFNNSDYRTIANNNGVQKNWEDSIQTNLLQILAPNNSCNLDNEKAGILPTSPCCRYNKNDKLCYYTLNGPPYNINNNVVCISDGSQPIENNISYRILYKKNLISLISGGRKQFNVQGGCPQWDSQRFYEYATFNIKSSNNKIIVYAPHLSQDKQSYDTKSRNEFSSSCDDSNPDGWGRQTNKLQIKELYSDVMSNFNTNHIPFVIAADLNYKALCDPDGNFWNNRTGVKIDGNVNTHPDPNNKNKPNQIDYVISSTDLKKINVNYVSTWINGHEATDHPYGIVVTYDI
jgi:endonuclease/exonuclease/phosphatase family metal-dependent hydrolase